MLSLALGASFLRPASVTYNAALFIRGDVKKTDRFVVHFSIQILRLTAEMGPSVRRAMRWEARGSWVPESRSGWWSSAVHLGERDPDTSEAFKFPAIHIGRSASAKLALHQLQIYEHSKQT